MSIPPEPGDSLIGVTVGNYQIKSKIGAGGMGAVYLATHPGIGRKVAVKVLLPEHSRRQDLITRFFNEAKATATLRHPALIEVFDFGFLPDGAGYLVMDFLEGESLAARLARVAPFAPEVAAEIGRQLAAGVAAAHANGIVHRDLKPDNVFLVPDPELPSGERVKILDFGIAKLSREASVTGSSSTSTGMVLGTPLYMAPEQCKGAGLVDHRADIYSIGCILYEMLSGRPPFDHEGAGEILAAHLLTPPRSLSEIDPSLPAEFVAIVAQALEKDPARRQQTMSELGVQLQRYLRSAGVADSFSGLGVSGLGSGAGRVVPSRPGTGGTGTLAAGQAAAAGVSQLGTAPTTFSSAASQALPIPPAPPPRSRGTLLVTTIVLATLGAGAALLLLRFRNADAPPVGTADAAASPGAGASLGAAGAAGGTNLVPAAKTDAATASAEVDAGSINLGKTVAALLTGRKDGGAGRPDGSVEIPSNLVAAMARRGEAAGMTRALEASRENRSGKTRPAAAHLAAALQLRMEGKEEEALRRYQAVLRERGSTAAERSEAEHNVLSLKRKFGEIEIISEVYGASVVVDGKPRGRTPLGQTILVRPGEHTVSITAPGQVMRNFPVSVGAARKEVVKFKR